jgi:signal transduction histidine kinase/ActR/RegA family two-component response regulator
VQSTPLLRRGRGVIGALATYHRQPHRPSERELHYLDLYTRQAADFMDHLLQREHANLANRRKDEFLAVLAHELRSPLAPIGAGLELLRTTVNDPAIVHEVHQIMQRQLDQLTALIEDVFDISCITRGVFSMKSRRIDMKSVVESAVEQMTAAVKAAGHKLTLDLPGQPLFFDGDPRRVVQALSNLLDNAIKFTPRGGMIRLSARREGDALVVSVEDNGVGIAPAELEKIFASSANDGSTAPSSGIGLTLVRSLIELHGGTIGVDSAGVGQGACFTLRLPAAAESVQDAPQAAHAQGASGLRILVVDDNGAAADMLAMILESYGNELLTAYSGQKAIELAETHQPDVILLDLGMPVIDGYEAARHIRRQPQGQEPMLIALTGWGHERDKKKAHEAGFDHYVVKPAKAEDLRALLAGAKRHGR